MLILKEKVTNEGEEHDENREGEEEFEKFHGGVGEEVRRLGQGLWGVLGKKGHVLVNVAFADVVDCSGGDAEEEANLGELFALNTKLADCVDVGRGEFGAWGFGWFRGGDGRWGGVEVLFCGAEDVVAGVANVVAGRDRAVVEEEGEAVGGGFFVVYFETPTVGGAVSGPEGAAVVVGREDAGEETGPLGRSDVGGDFLRAWRKAGGESGEDSGHGGRMWLRN